VTTAAQAPEIPHAVISQPLGLFPTIAFDHAGLSCRIDIAQPGRVVVAWRLPPAARSAPLQIDGAIAGERNTIWIRLEVDAPASVVVQRHADIDRDGFVDAADLSVLLGDWGLAEGRSDLNLDGVVDGLDHAILLGSWGWLPTLSPLTNAGARLVLPAEVVTQGGPIAGLAKSGEAP
jgi:hypothetical protein